MKTSCWIVVCLVVGVTWLLGTPVTTAAHLTETLALLQAPDWTVRRDAVVLLRTLGPTVRDNPEITAALVELAQSEELLPAWHAFLALNSIYQGALQEIYPAGVRKDIFTSIETLHINSSAIVRRLSAQKLLALVDEPTV